MTRKIVAGALVLAALAGCRTLVGIDDLQLAPQPNDGGKSQGNQQSQNGDGGISPAEQATIVGCADAGPDCRKCCKTNFTGVVSNYVTGPGADCVCSQCPDCKVNGTCDPTAAQGGAATPSACIVCSDTLLGQPGNVCDQCTNDPDGTCRAGLACLQNCH